MDKLIHVRRNVKKLKDECGGYKELYAHLHGRVPDRKDTQTFTNVVNRGVFKAELIMLIMEKFDLEGVSMGEFFTGDIQRPSKTSKPTKKVKSGK